MQIAVLKPCEQICTQESLKDFIGLPIPLLYFHLAHVESKNKSDRLRKIWQHKRQDPTPDNPLNKRRPSWVDRDEEAERFVLNDGAEAIRFIFEQTVAGSGQRQVVGELQRRFKPTGTSEKWNSSFVQSVLNDRAVLGEFQPHEFDDNGDRVPVAKPIPGYYPAVVDEGLWSRAQATKLRRKNQKGPSGRFVNLFTGLVFNGFDKHPMHVETTRAKHEQGVYFQRRLTSYSHKSKVAGSCSISVDCYNFERQMRFFLRDINPDDLIDASPRPLFFSPVKFTVAGLRRRISRPSPGQRSDSSKWSIAPLPCRCGPAESLCKIALGSVTRRSFAPLPGHQGNPAGTAHGLTARFPVSLLIPPH